MRRNIALWIGVLGGPLAWLCSFEARFALAPWACTFQNKLALYVVTWIAIVVCGACAAIAWRQWKALGEQGPSPDAGAVPRSAFMAIGGIVLSLGCCMIVIAQAIPEVVLGACE
jgi:hypothetical protein